MASGIGTGAHSAFALPVFGAVDCAVGLCSALASALGRALPGIGAGVRAAGYRRGRSPPGRFGAGVCLLDVRRWRWRVVGVIGGTSSSWRSRLALAARAGARGSSWRSRLALALSILELASCRSSVSGVWFWSCGGWPNLGGGLYDAAASGRTAWDCGAIGVLSARGLSRAAMGCAIHGCFGAGRSEIAVFVAAGGRASSAYAAGREGAPGGAPSHVSDLWVPRAFPCVWAAAAVRCAVRGL
jgi:hypothetical protein